METDTNFLQKIDDIIRTNLDNPTLNGDFIAQKLNLTRMQVHRRLKQVTNQSATDYINIARIDYAKTALRTTSKPVFQIAEACGFSHYTYFSKVFKKYTGLSPSNFRKT